MTEQEQLNYFYTALSENKESALLALDQLKNAPKEIQQKTKEHFKPLLDLFSKKTLKAIPKIIDTIEQKKCTEKQKEQLTTPSILPLVRFMTEFVIMFSDRETLPEEIGLLKNLRVLFIGNCPVQRLPKSIFKLEKLENLGLSDTKIQTLPTDIGQLKALKYLTIHNSPILELPDSLGDLQALTQLELWKTKIKRLPNSIGNLNKLEMLRVSNTNLISLPKTIQQLTQLTKVDLSFNALRILPKGFSSATNLVSLNLSNNKALKSIPPDIVHLEQLEKINLVKTSLKAMPRNMEKMSALKKLFLPHMNHYEEERLEKDLPTVELEFGGEGSGYFE